MSQRRVPGGGAAGPGGTGSNPGTRGALLLGVAVILGIVLLQQFDNDMETGGGPVAAQSVPDDEETTTTTLRRVELTVAPTTTAPPARPKAEVKVLVANGAGVRGLGAATTNALKALGYATLTPTDATTTIPKTSVQFVEGWAAEGREVAGALTLPPSVATPLASPPVAAADIGDAKVIVILGQDVTTTTAAGAAATTTSTTTRP